MKVFLIVLSKRIYTYLALAAVFITFIKTFNVVHVFCLGNACRAQQDFSPKMHKESKSSVYTIRWQWWISPLHIITEERKCIRQSMFYLLMADWRSDTVAGASVSFRCVQWFLRDCLIAQALTISQVLLIPLYWKPHVAHSHVKENQLDLHFL